MYDLKTHDIVKPQKVNRDIVREHCTFFFYLKYRTETTIFMVVAFSILKYTQYDGKILPNMNSIDFNLNETGLIFYVTVYRHKQVTCNGCSGKMYRQLLVMPLPGS